MITLNTATIQIENVVAVGSNGHIGRYVEMEDGTRWPITWSEREAILEAKERQWEEEDAAALPQMPDDVLADYIEMQVNGYVNC